MDWKIEERKPLLVLLIEAAGQEFRRGVAEAFVSQDKEGVIRITLTGKTEGDKA